MSEVFISYKQEERERMRPLADALRALGVDVWFDERLSPDRSFTEEITGVIGASRAQLVCWSPAAVASEWVRGEAEKGRQRGVLVAVIIEDCDLPPPFNMHHAENLVGWTGDPRHTGWRKVAEAIGRKLDRPGLGEYAGLQASSDPSAWKKWAQKYANDPQADAAWAKAEELEIGAARERMARERDTAKQAAKEAERKRLAEAPAPTVQGLSLSTAESKRRGPSFATLALGVGALGAVAAAAIYIAMQQQAPRVASGPDQRAAVEAQEERIRELEQQLATLLDSREIAEETPPTLQEDVRVRELQTQISAARAERDAARPAPSRSAPAPQSAPDDASSALAALRAISGQDWQRSPLRDMLERVIAQSSKPSLDAAARTNARAQSLVGRAYADGLSGYPRDLEEAARYYRMAADQGDINAQINLGYAYHFGRGVSIDYTEAARYYRLAADRRHRTAQNNLAILYRDGLGVEQDRAEAARLFRLSADQGLVAAQRQLGAMYLLGQGVAQDYLEAERLYRLAADQGDANAQGNLAYLYLNGYGVPLNYAEAVRWARMSADAGNSIGQVNLGWLYENGHGGLTADRAEAVRFYQLSARQGVQIAQQNLTRLGETW